MKAILALALLALAACSPKASLVNRATTADETVLQVILITDGTEFALVSPAKRFATADQCEAEAQSNAAQHKLPKELGAFVVCVPEVQFEHLTTQIEGEQGT